ncbi:hypothetical protein TBLA_0J00810 [Henningerozyma blattae CBS 6284]|uniref:FAS1 domain-containing protein n=1 Tax=Henningerozyma blattae (strain ATCC 34711 / CBS 6284 / DSM 70876 / NBRC 10599 / NRRL Y-10934 / UCD 77-7) TaxID=1071380 RepID=I2H9M7_HENB6|nr:hypothetical protein TBLA_0J00810 [Tetrapisispora blattae CBS 6284]CCH63079.1 hypothetical protein TBLA_0J00810 [Tetrapisispora blattae CBS 6284]
MQVQKQKQKQLQLQTMILIKIFIFILFYWDLYECKNIVSITNHVDEHGVTHRQIVLSKLPIHTKVSHRDNIEHKRMQESFNNMAPLDTTLSISKRVDIFNSYLRNVKETFNLISEAQGRGRIMSEQGGYLVLTPLNEAIFELKLKPWEFPRDIHRMEGQDKDEIEVEEAINENIKDFINAHVVKLPSLKNLAWENANDNEAVVHLQSLSSADIRLKSDDEGLMVCGDGNTWIRVGHIEKCSNGVIMFINKSLVIP